MRMTGRRYSQVCLYVKLSTQLQMSMLYFEFMLGTYRYRTTLVPYHLRLSTK